MKITFRHLEILREVARTGNFTKAAQRLYITQSAVSHAVKELEEQTGTALFDRLSKSVKLTKCGEVLLEESIPILASCETLEAHMKNLESRAPISIVSSITVATFFLPDILNRFRKEWPDIPVEVNVVSASNAMNILREGKADFALIEGAEPEEPYHYHAFASCSLMIAASPDYFPGERRLTIEAFCRENLLLREKGSAIRDVLDSELYLSGHTVHPIWTSVNSQSLIEAAKAGIGLAVLPDVLVKKQIEKGELAAVEVEGLQLENEMFFVYHKDKFLTEPLRKLKELCEHFKIQNDPGSTENISVHKYSR